MISISTHRYFRPLLELALLALVAWAISGALVFARPQATNAAPGARKPIGLSETAAQPLYREYRGVLLGMTASEARQKLGVPTDKGDEQDFYAFSEQEMAQIYYDQAQRVKAVSVNYLGGGAPSPQSILGVAVEPGEDGSIYKLLKYPKAGYWVSYSRTAGEAPMVTVVMQKF